MRGCSIGIGIDSVSGGGLTPSIKAKLIFLGKYSEISGGKMPNKIDGGATWLVVTGSAGSEVYQCPENATFLVADTDYLWFNPLEDLRSVKTSELISFDFTRTLVKYAPESPYAIEEIAILSSDLSAGELDNAHKYFKLPVFWSGNENDFGETKDNRIDERSVWYEELFTFANAASIKGRYEANATTGISAIGLDGANTLISQSTVVDGSDYAIKADCNAAPVSAARGWFDLSTLGLTDGVNYTISFRARHTGVGAQTGQWRVGLSNLTNGSYISIMADMTKVTFLNFATYTIDVAYSANARYLVFREQNAENDGGIYLDNISIKYKL